MGGGSSYELRTFTDKNLSAFAVKQLLLELISMRISINCAVKCVKDEDVWSRLSKASMKDLDIV